MALTPSAPVTASSNRQPSRSSISGISFTRACSADCRSPRCRTQYGAASALSASASAAVSPPIPAPAMTIVGGEATDRSGGLVLHHAFRRARFAGAQIRGKAIQRRAIGADDLVVIAEIEEHVRMVERWIGADAH